MESSAEKFSGLDLSTLPFSINKAARDRIDSAGDAFDAARPDSRVWQSWSRDSSHGISSAFLTTVVLPSPSADWAEIDLGAEFETSTLLRITCEIQVSCWCNTDHTMHIVE